MSTIDYPRSRRARPGARFGAFGATALSVVLASCSGAATPSAPSTSTPGASLGSSLVPGGFPDIAAIFAPTEPPIDLTVTAEANNTVTATIPISGGELTATGADGTVYTLTIPGDALIEDTAISMTPVTTVSGLPTSGDVTYAVQLAPDGLYLDNFATLTIAPAQDLPLDQQIPFGYEAAGKGMFLAPPVVKDPSIQLQILHFSGYGVTKGLLADLAPVRQRLGGDAAARLNSQMAEALTRERALALSGHPASTDLVALFEDLLDQYQREVVDPRVAAAGKSCANAQVALQTVLSTERQKALLGFASAPFPSDLVTTLAHVCTQEEYELCRDEHIVHRMIPVMLGMERQRQLLGSPDPAEEAFEKDLATKCLTFEVRFESEGTVQQGGVDVVSKVESKVKIMLDPEALTIKGDSALTNTEFQITVPVDGGCSIQSNRGGSDLKVFDLRFVVEGRSLTEPGHVSDFILMHLPGTTTESGSITCPRVPPQPLAGPWWSAIFLGTHPDERQTGSGPYTTEGWTVAQATKLGTKDWDNSAPVAHLAENGSFELYHQPQ